MVVVSKTNVQILDCHVKNQQLHLMKYLKTQLEMRGIEPRAFHMRSERSTTELHPQHKCSGL